VNSIIRAAAILRSGGVVAFPTETVYGLGADATNADAVRKIFQIKGRPSTNPLICHVADANVARRYARDWPPAASRLAERFWPGALSLVLPRHESIVPEVTGGRDTVALRVPDHELTLQLLRVVDLPIAGPSANKSNHVSPTTAQHVRDELCDAVDMILDGGPCTVGIESTVLDLSGARPTILRPGGISREQIEQVIGPVDLFSGVVDSSTTALSPGQHAKHYAPCTPAYRFDPQQRATLDLSDASVIDVMHNDAESYARDFYARLRELDARGLGAIYIELPPDTPQWTAIRDRVIRATLPLPA
jgi:L-threonylcarbamoyladenylate synthase